MRSAVVCLLCVLARLCVSLSPLTQCLQEFVQVHFLPGVLQLWYWQDEDKEPEKPFQWKMNPVHDILYGLTTTGQHTVLVKNNAWQWPIRHSVRSDVSQANSIVMVLNGESVTHKRLLHIRLDACMKHPLWRSQTRLLVVVQGLDFLRDAQVARIVLKKLWEMSKVANVVVLVHPKLRFYKWVPFEEDCGEVKGVDLVETWQDGFVQNATLFREISKLHGCRLRAGAIPNPPYVLPPVPGEGFVEGVEVRMLRVLQDKFNFTVEWVPLPPGVSPWLVFADDGHLIGYWAMLVKRTLDMACYGLGIKQPRTDIADTTSWYLEDALVWVVPTPHIIAPWRNLVDVFTQETWLLTGATFLLLSITLYLLQRRSFSSSFLDSWAMHMGQPVTVSQRLRVFIVFTSMTTMLVATHYVSDLAALLNGDRHSEVIETPLAASKQGLTTFLLPSSKNVYNQSDHELWNYILQPDRHVYSEAYFPTLRRIAYEKSAITLTSEISVKHTIANIYTNQFGQPSLQILKNKFLKYRVSMYMSQGHPMVDIFSKKIDEMVQAGLLERWQLEVSSMNKTLYIEHEDGHQSPLTIRHLSGVFWILIIMHALSLTCFLAEIAVHQIKTKRVRIKP